MINISFNDACQLTEDEARPYFEKVRWGNEPACFRCGGTNPYKINRKSQKGVYRCRECKKDFTVMTGTVFERSHVSIKHWIMASSLISASKKGISAHQIHRMLGVTYKTAWFIMHRLRFAMVQPPVKEKLKGTIEIDETYVGGKARGKRGRGAANKEIVVSLVQRNGTVRSKHMQKLTADELKGYIRENVHKEAELMTDDFKSYKKDLTKNLKVTMLLNTLKRNMSREIFTPIQSKDFSVC